MDKSLEQLAKKRELLASLQPSSATSPNVKGGAQEAEMSDEMAAFIQRKREAEEKKTTAASPPATSTSGDDEKARRKAEILRRIQERRKAKGAGASNAEATAKSTASAGTGGDSSKPSVVEEVRKRREQEAEKRGAEAAKKEAAEEYAKKAAEAEDAFAAEKAELEKKLADSEKAKEDLAAKESASQAALDELRSSLMKEKDEAVALVQAEKDVLVQEHSAALSRAADGQSDAEAASARLQQLESDLAAAKASLSEAVAKNEAEAKAAEEKLSQALAEAKAEVEAEKAKVVEAEEKVASLSTANEELKASAGDAGDLEATLEMLQEVQTAHSEAVDKVTALESLLEDEKIRGDLLQEENDILTEQVTSAAMMGDGSSRSAEVEADLAKEKSQREALEAQVAEKEKEVEAAKREAEEEKKAVEAEVEALRKEKEELLAAASTSASASASTTRSVETEPVAKSSDVERETAVAKALEGASSGLGFDLLKEINEARTQPGKYAASLKEMLGCFDGLLFAQPGDDFAIDTKEGVKGLEDAIEALEKAAPAPALNLAPGLSASCQDLCDTNGPLGLVSDATADGVTAQARLARHGVWEGKINELMSYGASSSCARTVVRQWLIDDGNPSKLQRKTLLDPSFKSFGVGSGDHTEFDHMTVVALAQSFALDSSTGIVSREKTELRESSDGTCFVITSQPCRVERENVKVLMKGKTLAVVTKRHDGESLKTFTHQWNLPFAVPVCNVSATYTDATEVEIVIKKKASDVVGGVQSVKAYDLPVAGVSNTRLKVDVKQQPQAILFTTEPCACAVAVDLKIIDGTTLCFESVYTEVDGTETKTITRKETVSLPFAIAADRLSFEKTDAGGLTVSLLKPSVDSASEISIPLE